jgi:murein DD-endopeptidase MepM/ murein hydrolase activator NlpD
MSVACLACIVAIPFVEKKLFNTQAGYYSIQFNGQEVGAANTRAEAEEALAAARLKFSKEYDSVVYMDDSIDIVKQNKAVAERMNQEELEDALYSTMFACVSDKEDATAYTLRIDDFTVTLASKDDIVELMQRVTAKYDTNNEFQVKLTSGDSSYGTYAVEVVKSEVGETAKDIVAAALNGSITALNDESVSTSVAETSAIQGISFEQDISIIETRANDGETLSVDDAYEAITKEKEAKTTYIVEAGDCLSIIADKYDISLNELLALNEGMTENTLIAPGDVLVVTVPKSELSAVITVRKTYEEDFDAEIQYVDDDTQYRGYSQVISEGSSGHHIVTADITTVNGVQTSITYVEETVTVEPVAKVVSVGTLTPPTYLKPVSGTYSSGFGYRDGSTHKGVDWSCSTGTPVYAAASGTVIRAGWYSGYGYCVDIRHSDGSMTRYGHLSSVAVSVGQTVNQSSLIAYSGNTGDSSGPHLHFEIWINGVAVNPLNYVNKN